MASNLERSKWSGRQWPRGARPHRRENTTYETGQSVHHPKHDRTTQDENSPVQGSQGLNKPHSDTPVPVALTDWDSYIASLAPFMPDTTTMGQETSQKTSECGSRKRKPETIIPSPAETNSPPPYKHQCMENSRTDGTKERWDAFLASLEPYRPKNGALIVEHKKHINTAEPIDAEVHKKHRTTLEPTDKGTCYMTELIKMATLVEHGCDPIICEKPCEILSLSAEQEKNTGKNPDDGRVQNDLLYSTAQRKQNKVRSDEITNLLEQLITSYQENGPDDYPIGDTSANPKATSIHPRHFLALVKQNTRPPDWTLQGVANC